MENALKRLRKERGLTQTELASAIGKTQSDISHIETGRLRITVDKLKPLAKALGVAIEELLEDE